MEQEPQEVEITESSLSDETSPINIWQRQTSRQRRLLQIAALVIAILLGFVELNGPITSYLVSIHPYRSPSIFRNPPIHLAIQTNVSYGSLILNGKSTSFILGAQDYPETVSLRAGKNTIIFQAPPFTAITCVIDTSNSTKATENTQDRCTPTKTEDNIWSLNLSFFPSDLPYPARQQFDDFIHQQLAHFQSIRATITSNTHYAEGYLSDNTPAVAISQTPLPVHVIAETHVFGQASPYCREAYCDFSPISLPQTDGMIPHFVTMTYGAVFRWQSDAIVSPNQLGFPDLDTCNTQSVCYLPFTFVPLTLSYTSQSGWMNFSDPEYTPGRKANQDVITISEAFSENAENLISYLYQSHYGANATLFMGAIHQSAQSCLIAEVTTNIGNGPGDLNTSPITDTTKAWFLEHFGVVLAVNAMAQAQFPQMPRATATEINEALQA